MKYLMVAVLLFSNLSLFNSLKSQEDLGDLFDDGGASTPFGAVKLDISSIFTGTLMVGLEYYVNESISVKLSAGPRLGYHRYTAISLLSRDIFENPPIEDVTGGFDYSLSARIFYNDFDSGVYNALIYRVNSINVEQSEDPYRISGLGLAIGYALPLFSRLSLEGDFTLYLTSYNDAATEGLTNNNFLESDLVKTLADYGIRLSYQF